MRCRDGHAELPLDDWQRDPFVGHLLEAFFIERLMTQRQARSHTIAGYRDRRFALSANGPSFIAVSWR
jgi:hypothetical protein